MNRPRPGGKPAPKPGQKPNRTARPPRPTPPPASSPENPAKPPVRAVSAPDKAGVRPATRPAPKRNAPPPSAEPAPGAGEEIVVQARGLAVGGNAVGSVVGPAGSDLIGITAFVPFAAPGEVVRAAVRKRAARHLEADLVSVEAASPDRTEPRCPYFGTCGGCDIQHLTYDAQLAAKHELVRGVLRSGGVPAAAELVAPVVPGPPYGYRQRITLHLDETGRVGYHRRRTHDLLVPKTCPISVAALDEWLGRGFTLEGIVEERTGELAVEAAENGIFGVLRLPAPRPSQGELERLVEHLQAHFVGGAVEVGGKTAAAFGAAEMVRRIEAEEFHGTAGVFSQVNPAVNALLVAKIVETARAAGARTAHDLYAGAGNFSLPLAATAGARVFAVESDPVLVTLGRSEAARRGIPADGCIFVESDVEKFLRKRPERIDLVVADPPRAGLGPLTDRFDYCDRMILVSCHLPSAARDLKGLVANGWRVTEVVPFDMFAETGYVELLSVLERA